MRQDRYDAIDNKKTYKLLWITEIIISYIAMVVFSPIIIITLTFHFISEYLGAAVIWYVFYKIWIFPFKSRDREGFLTQWYRRKRGIGVWKTVKAFVCWEDRKNDWPVSGAKLEGVRVDEILSTWPNGRYFKSGDFVYMQY